MVSIVKRQCLFNTYVYISFCKSYCRNAITMVITFVQIIKGFTHISLTLCNVPAIQDKGFSCWNNVLLRHKIIFRQDSPCLLVPSVTILFLFRVLSIVNWQTEWDLRGNTISRWLQIKRQSYPVSLSFHDWSKWTEVAFRRNWATVHLWAHLNLKRFDFLITRY